MARRASLVAYAASIAGVVCACNALTGVSDLTTSDEGASSSGASGSSGGGGGDGGSGTGDGSVTITTDGAADDSSVVLGDAADSAPPANAFLATFDDPSECLAWTVNGGTRTHDNDGHNAPGSCRLCFSAVNSAGTEVSMTRKVTAAVDGRFGPQVWLRRPGTATSPARYSFTFVKGGVTVASGGNLTNTWSVSGGSRFGGKAGEELTFTVGIPEAGMGDCLLVDDVIVRTD